MTISTTFKESFFAQQTGECPLFLLTLEHDDLEGPVRLVNNQEAITSRGNEYSPCAFEITLPDDKAEELPKLRLTIDNVAREIVQTVRDLASAPTVTIEIVLASDPDTVEATAANATLETAEYDALSVVGTFGWDDLLAEPFPSGTFDPLTHPGLFE